MLMRYIGSVTVTEYIVIHEMTEASIHIAMWRMARSARPSSEESWAEA